MVRLKVPNTIGENKCLGISIPYGAIKSKIHFKRPGKLEKFQFLMVRLKAIKFIFRTRIKFLFQFLMVRLKEFFELAYRLVKKEFQFLMVRLKVR